MQSPVARVNKLPDSCTALPCWNAAPTAERKQALTVLITMAGMLAPWLLLPAAVIAAFAAKDVLQMAAAGEFDLLHIIHVSLRVQS